MLTSTQCQVVAYTDEGGFYCPPCAAKQHGVEDPRTKSGYRLTSRYEEVLNPIIQYELDCYHGEVAEDYRTEGYSEQEAEDLARPHCQMCHNPIDG